MSGNSFQLAVLVSILFFVVKVIEQKYIQKTPTIDYKIIFRNSIISGITSFIGSIILEQFMTIQTTAAPSVFTGEPGF